MTKIRGLKLGKRIKWISRWVFRRTRTRPGYRMLSSKPMSKLMNWLRNGAKSMYWNRSRLSYVALESKEKGMAVPRGHLAVYVGEKEREFQRVKVPVIYFNHPLFGELLREAEKEYGFHHHGGITLPCPYSEFESVRTRIQSGSGTRNPPRKFTCYGRDDDDDEKDSQFSEKFFRAPGAMRPAAQ